MTPETPAIPADLTRFFRPRRVAVVGASDTPGRPATGIWRQLREWAGHVGTSLVPVNPKRETVDGIACFPTLADVSAPIDVAVLLVAEPAPALAEAVAAGVGFAVVFGAGFAELGEAGAAAQQALLDTVAGTGTRLLGPNTNLNAFQTFRGDLPGPAIALISQSGHQGRPVFQAQEIGIRLSHWAPTGNEADLEFADFATWFAAQPEVGAIAAYIEGFRDGRTLRAAAEAAARHGTPIVVVKVGRTEAGRAMAASHTGKLAGSDAVISAAFRQFGVTRVDGLDELIDSSALLARARRRAVSADAPERSPGVVVYSISGGTGAHMADLCSAAGLWLPRLSQATQHLLHQWIPAYLTVSNPVDNGGHPVGDERGRLILDALLADPDLDVLIAPITGAFPPMSDHLAQDLVDAAETTDKLICVIWGSPVGTEAAYRDILLSSSRLAVFRTFGNCVTALQAWQKHGRFLARRADAPTPASGSALSTASTALLAGRKTLSEHDSKLLLAEYGIRRPVEELVDSLPAARRAAERIGYPLVLKACAADLAHKSEHGLVAVGLGNEAELDAAYERIAARAPVALDGMLVGELLTGGVETIVGIVHDPLFGPVVMAGFGGVLVEVLGDVTFRVPPFGVDEARRMLAELRGYPLLGGVRGRPAVDEQALAEVIVSIGRLALDGWDQLAEVDINPLLVRADGAVALDALVVCR
jgi:acyl-CoA synthetase (NDP forming)